MDLSLFTLDALREIAGCSLNRASLYHEPMLRTMERYGIDTKLRMAHWLAQVLHESGRLRYIMEIWGPTPAQLRYERSFDHSWPPTDDDPRNRLAFTLGNEEKGDGFRFRGRGLIQLTGRGNYKLYSAAVGVFGGVGFVVAPDHLARRPWCVDVAGWYWQRRDLNTWADADDLRQVTRRINGGLNGFADRQQLLTRAKYTLLVQEHLSKLAAQGGMPHRPPHAGGLH